MQHQGPIAGIAAHGKYIATAGYDNQIILWDSATREALARANHDHLVNHCAFSADGRWLVSASSDYSARVWSVPSLHLHAVLRGHRDDVDMAVFSPDDRFIASCALDRCVRIFDMTGNCLHEMHGHTGNVLALAWTRDGRQLVSTSVDGTIRTWDAHRGGQVKVADLQVRTDSVEIAGDGTIYAGDDRGRIAVIGAAASSFIGAHRAGIKKIALDELNGILLSLSYDRSIAVWRIAGGGRLQELARSTFPEAIWARAATLLADGRIATGTFGATYALFDRQTLSWDMKGVAAGPGINAVLKVGDRTLSVGDAGTIFIDGAPAAHMGSLCNFLTASGEHVYTGGQLGRLFDAKTGATLHAHRSPLNCGVAFERQGVPHIAIGCYTGEILIFALDACGVPQLRKELRVYENAVKGLSCGDGMLFSVCASTEIAWHRLEDWSPIKRIPGAHERIANACCAVGSATFASVGRDRTLRLWGSQCAESYRSEHPNSIKCIAVDDAHTMILTGSYGGTVALFDLARRRWKDLRRPTSAGISSIAWDRSSRQFLAGSYDGRIYPIAP
jgi:WD40 repeat protein